MKHSLLLTIAATLLGLTLAGCTDDIPLNLNGQSQFDEGDLDEIPLSIKVNELSVNAATRDAVPSATPEKATADDNYVADMWVFQYNASGELIIKPRYYEVESQEELANFPVYLKSNVPSYVYVVTNTQNDSWASSYTAFNTIDKLKNQTLVNPRPVALGSDNNEGNYIPMEGMTAETVTPSVDEPIDVHVTRMYAKIKVKINFADALPDYYNDIEVSYVYVENIPEYCQVTSISSDEDEETAVDFPEGTNFISKALNGTGTEVDDDGYPYVIYVPENLRGESGNNEEAPDEKATNHVPDNALSITVRINFKNKDDDDIQTGIYTVYPGGNDYNNFNIRRNDVYRVTLNVGYPLEETLIPSANCICGLTGETLSFYPYYRVETGGDGISDYYKFSNYLDPTDEEKTIKGLKILWQTENCIGDNTGGNRVYLSKNASQEEAVLQYKIYVKTAAAGNAVIAAYNNEECTGDILWSWHIWVRDEAEGDPTNIANAITYYTYDWDETGIHTNNTRIMGYPVMNCNLGALADKPASTNWEDYSKTYGTLYQWGRKDPFPPCKYKGNYSGPLKYDDTNGSNVVVYDNENILIYMTGNDGMPGEGEAYTVFNSILTTSLDEQTCAGGIAYSIQHPTMFIAAATEISSSSSNAKFYNYLANYCNKGDWLPIGDDCLWGGTDAETCTKQYQVYTTSSTSYAIDASLRDNYGPDKTIFDPCPYGWRTAPGDMWLGFTTNGKNQSTFANLNCCDDSFSDVYNNKGYYMYMQGWKVGQTSFFPTQGTRITSGQPWNGGRCGNYHNATADGTVEVKEQGGNIEKDAIKRVDILHFHSTSTSAGYINIFDKEICYYTRATAGPIRCVRETK